MNSLINAHAQDGDKAGAVKYYEEMKAQGLRANEITMSSLINAHAQDGDKAGAVKYYEEMKAQGLRANEITMNSLINAHAQDGDKAGAVKYYEEMKAQGLRADEITMNSVLKAFVSSSRRYEILEKDIIMFRKEMQKLNMQYDRYTYGQLLLAYKKFKKPDIAKCTFDELLTRMVEPTDMLCGVLKDTLGDAEYYRYVSANAIRMEAARSFARTQRAGKKKGGGVVSHDSRRNVASSEGYQSHSSSSLTAGRGAIRGGGSHINTGAKLTPHRSSSSSSSSSSSASSRRDRVCKFWKDNGLCRKGASCEFNHA
jgi:pentatricopeptide repeat protein